MKLLDGIKVVNLAINLPGPACGRRLTQLGAQVVKVEPPTGDPMFHFMPKWHAQMSAGQEIVTLDLKSEKDMESLDRRLEKADLLITASRPAALERLGLGWEELHKKFPNLCQVAIVGYPPPHDNEPGHDLTYQAKIGLLTPPNMPRTLIADMAGAEIASSEALALLLAKQRGQEAGYAMVALSDAADYMAEPFRIGFTASGTMVGGGLPEYNLYETSDGWLAVAALEPHFRAAMEKALDFDSRDPEDWKPIFAKKSALEWEEWAKEFDLPILAVR